MGGLRWGSYWCHFTPGLGVGHWRQVEENIYSSLLGTNFRLWLEKVRSCESIFASTWWGIYDTSELRLLASRDTLEV